MSTILKALKHNFAVGDTSYTFNDSNITDNAIIDVYFTKDVTYECSQTGNTVTVEIPAQTVVVGCAIVINNVDSVDYPITASDVSYFDTTVNMELLEHRSELNSLGDAVGILDETKQGNLTAGNNITIENNVISSSSSGFNYSTNEVNIHRKWIDNSDIYMICKQCTFTGTLPTTSWTNCGSVSNIKRIIQAHLSIESNGIANSFPVLISVNNGVLYLRPLYDSVTVDNNSYIIIEYTKAV